MRVRAILASSGPPPKWFAPKLAQILFAVVGAPGGGNRAARRAQFVSCGCPQVLRFLLQGHEFRHGIAQGSPRGSAPRGIQFGIKVDHGSMGCHRQSTGQGRINGRSGSPWAAHRLPRPLSGLSSTRDY